MPRDFETLLGILDSEETQELARQALDILPQEAAFPLVMLWLKNHNLLEEADSWINNTDTGFTTGD